MQNDEILEQIVVPEMHRNHIIHVEHDIPLGGHLGNKRQENFFISFLLARDISRCR